MAGNIRFLASIDFFPAIVFFESFLEVPNLQA